MALDKLKLGLIGCGAVAQHFHLPAIARSHLVALTAIVDTNLHASTMMARDRGAVFVGKDYHDLIGNIECAIVALPNCLHAPVTVDLLKHGIHVLVEKPMALNVTDCNQMISAAEVSNTVLAVGLIRRYYPQLRYVKKALELGILGNVASFDCREGTVFQWPVTSDSLFKKATAGGGVLVDIGVHLLDLLLWWFGDCEGLECYDDAEGGVEAECKLNVAFGGGLAGVVELSRTRHLRNSCIIFGERGVLEVDTGFDGGLSLRLKECETQFVGKVADDKRAERDIVEAFTRQVDDFANAIISHRGPYVTGREGARSVGVIERCYAVRRVLPVPWLFPEVLCGASGTCR